MRSNPYNVKLEHELVRYVRALDEPDIEPRLLKLWGLLESVTESGGNDYKETIKRAVFLFPKEKTLKFTLTQIKNIRK